MEKCYTLQLHMFGFLSFDDVSALRPSSRSLHTGKYDYVGHTFTHARVGDQKTDWGHSPKSPAIKNYTEL